MKRLMVFVGVWWPSILTFLLALLATTIFAMWGYCESVNTMQPRNEIARNYGLLIAASWGAFIAIWRGQIATKQAEAAIDQADTANMQAKVANRQAETSARGLMNDRYQTASNMLSSDKLATRLGAVYALEQLAEENPAEYRQTTIRLLCAFIRSESIDRNNALASAEKQLMSVRAPDIQDAVTVSCRLNSIQFAEAYGPAKLDLHGAKLQYTAFNSANLEACNFRDADLQGSALGGCNLRRANLFGTNLRETSIMYADLREADLTRAHLQDSHLLDTKIQKARIQFAELQCADLRETDFQEANLIGANFTNANMNGANLHKASLGHTGQLEQYSNIPQHQLERGRAKLQGVRNLTQQQLDQANGKGKGLPWAGPDLKGAFCAGTGKPLRWN